MNDKKLLEDKKAELENIKAQQKKHKQVTKYIILIAIVLITFLLLRSCSTNNIQDLIDNRGIKWNIDKDGKDNRELDLDNLQAIKDEFQRNTDATATAYTIASGIVVDKDGQGLFLIENAKLNKCLFQVEIKEDKTGTLIYTSPVLEPETSIKYDKVQNSLPAGTYDATAIIYKYSLDGQTLLNFPEVEVKIQFKD